jgi:hypothetical protein
MSGLRGVFVSTEAFLVCMSHALTTEKEEVMGLLLGDIKVRPFSYIFLEPFTRLLIPPSSAKKSARGAIAFVSHVSVLTRCAHQALFLLS